MSIRTRSLVSTAIVCLLWIGGAAPAESAEIRLFAGWQSEIRALRGGSALTEHVSEATRAECQNARSLRVAQLTAQGYHVLLASGCVRHHVGLAPSFGRVHLELEDLIVVTIPEDGGWAPPIPDCAVCLSLSGENVASIYGEDAPHVRELIETFGIDAYRDEVRALAERYDLRGFEDAMYELESSLEAAGAGKR